MSDAERAEAVQLSMALKNLALAARESIAQGKVKVHEAEQVAMQTLQSRGWQPDYLTLRRQRDLSQVPGPCGQPMGGLGAARLGKTRLIDNLEV